MDVFSNVFNVENFSFAEGGGGGGGGGVGGVFNF